MPPKTASKKSVEKEKQKIIEDKTFGLKNKNKSKKVEKYIKSVQSQVANKGFDKVIYCHCVHTYLVVFLL